jgi:hypothetical protein
MEHTGDFDENYRLFGSKGRGEPIVEKLLEKVIEEKQTPDNLEIMAKAVAVDWKNTDTNVSRMKFAFSDFEKKMEMMRPEIERFYAKEKRKRSPVSSDGCI